MENEANYRVLWVDDDEDIIFSFPPYVGEKYHIDLDVATNWEEAEQLLRVHFKEYSAIILDAYCKLKKTDKLPNNLFLGQVSSRLSMIFGEKHAFIPWYVLSAGTMDNFDIVKSIIETEERKQMEPLWGEMLYKKEENTQLKDSKNVEKLLNNIRKIAAEKTTNKVLLRHADVFKYLGKEDFVDYTKSRTYILKMLSALYNPEENLDYEYEGNPLRHVVEYIFRTANDFGLLPDDCFSNDDQLILLDSSRFLAGMTIRCFDRKKKTTVNYFKRIAPGTNPVFSEIDSEVVKDILNFTNSDSHTSKNDPYIIEKDKKEIFFGYVLLLCHVVKVFGRYIETHNDKNANLATIERIDAPAVGESVQVILSQDKSVALCSSKCKLPNWCLSKEGETIVIESVEVNPDKDSSLYPLFAKVKPQKGINYKEAKPNYKKSSWKDKSIVEIDTTIPPIDSLRYKIGTISLDKDGRYAMFGAYCILPTDFKKHISHKVKIIQIRDNPNKHKDGIPYIAEKAELVDVEPIIKTDPDQSADAILEKIPND
jgi:hypothetical protein